MGEHFEAALFRGYGDWAGQERSGSVVQVGGDGGGDGECDPLHLPASQGSPSRLRTATAHRTLRCSGPTVRVTAADLSLGSANPWPFSDPGWHQAGRRHCGEERQGSRPLGEDCTYRQACMWEPS